MSTQPKKKLTGLTKKQIQQLDNSKSKKTVRTSPIPLTVRETTQQVGSTTLQETSKVDQSSDLINEIEKIIKIYEDLNDEYRASSFKRLVFQLKKSDTVIRTVSDAQKHLTGVGSTIIDLIHDFELNGFITRRVRLENDIRVKNVRELLTLPDTSPTTVSSWYNQGIWSLNQLRERHLNGTLHPSLQTSQLNHLLQM
jgi:hypothetical protein